MVQRVVALDQEQSPENAPAAISHRLLAFLQRFNHQIPKVKIRRSARNASGMIVKTSFK